MINQRKEYFHFTLVVIDRALKDASVEIDLINIPEAREYRETPAIIEDRNKLLENSTKVIESEFPETI